MEHPITQFFGRKISNEVFDLKLGQVVSFVTGILLFALSIMKLTKLDLSETELYFGVLLSLTVFFLCIIMGLLLPMSTAAGRQKA